MDAVAQGVAQSLKNGDAASALRLCLENDVSHFPGFAIDELRQRRDDLPSVVVIAMMRSGSTYLAKSLESAGGYLNISYARLARTDETMNPHIYWLQLPGVMARIHSLPTPGNLAYLNAAKPDRIIFLERAPVDAAFSEYVRARYRRREKDAINPEISEETVPTISKEAFMKFMQEATARNLRWTRSWHANLERLVSPALQLTYEEFFADVGKGLEQVAAFVALPEPLSPAEKSEDSNFVRPHTAAAEETYREWLAEFRLLVADL